MKHSCLGPSNRPLHNTKSAVLLTSFQLHGGPASRRARPALRSTGFRAHQEHESDLGCIFISAFYLLSLSLTSHATSRITCSLRSRSTFGRRIICS
ncbi:hypothetical protein EJ02DRAFT_79759 [Clathrospora elynae]|uniref:Uncharacterized protein n=1 Tax=Clathrospora elynae TaxID=706981 RepID=A0A6A5SZL4_9PLEO|nr:hypothetical protein EJ02DRAFT_79759 [Clathrospora elynae]